MIIANKLNDNNKNIQLLNKHLNERKMENNLFQVQIIRLSIKKKKKL